MVVSLIRLLMRPPAAYGAKLGDSGVTYSPFPPVAMTHVLSKGILFLLLGVYNSGRKTLRRWAGNARGRLHMPLCFWHGVPCVELVIELLQQELLANR